MSALAKKKVVITRAAHQTAEFESLLRERGAVPLLYPCIDIVPPVDLTPLSQVVQAALKGEFDWLVLTSTNTVFALQTYLQEQKIAAGDLKFRHVAAVGSATAAAASEQLGFEIDTIPDQFTAEALVFSFAFKEGERVLLPQSGIAEPALADALRKSGAAVTVVVAYRTVAGRGGVHLPERLAAGSVDAITFTSASTVDNFMLRLETEGGDRALLASICIACIGTKTAAAARRHALTVSVIPAEHTVPALVNALESYYAQLLIGEAK